MSYSELPHLRSNVAGVAANAAPAVAIGAGAGVGAAVTSHTGNDQYGTIVLTSAGTPAAGVLATVTFATPYTTVPSVVVGAGDANAAAAELYATVSATTLTIKSAAAVAVATGVTVNYHVIGGA